MAENVLNIHIRCLAHKGKIMLEFMQGEQPLAAMLRHLLSHLTTHALGHCYPTQWYFFKGYIDGRIKGCTYVSRNVFRLEGQSLTSLMTWL